MKIVFVIPSLICGGAEGNLALLANTFAERNNEITVLTWDDGTIPPFYILSASIKHRALNLQSVSGNHVGALFSNIKRIRHLKSALKKEKPDTVVSFLEETNVISILACLGMNVPTVACVRVSPQAYPRNPIWRALRALVYPLAKTICVQYTHAKVELPFWVRHKVVVIPNPVRPATGDDTNEDVKAASPFVLAIGRLEKQKGFDILLKSFQKFLVKNPSWNLALIGEGSQELFLKRQAASLGITTRVFFLGKITNPQTYLRKAAFFILPSRFEGFPNALCEAMAAGLAVITTDAPGSHDIVEDGQNGLMVAKENAEALTEAMQKLTDQETRKRLGRNAKDITLKFPLEKMISQWEKILR